MIKKLSHITLGLFLTGSMIISSANTPALAEASTDNTDIASHFETITREYTDSDGSLLHYHYVDDNGNTVSTENTGSNRRKKASSLPTSYDL